MIIARNCIRLSRCHFFPLECYIRFCQSNNNFFSYHDNFGVRRATCRYRHIDAPLADLKMDNASRTSAVVLGNIYNRVSSFHNDPSLNIKKSFTKISRGWACTIYLKWPEPHEFRAEESKKSEAARVASWLALEWLKSINKIDSNGKPILVDDVDPKLTLSLYSEQKNSISTLTNKYEQEIKSYYNDYDKEHSADFHYLDGNEIPSFKGLSIEDISDRNDTLLLNIQNLPPRISLPVDELGEQIVETIEKNRVVVIKGATGSGKTTRVPQFLFDFYCRNGNGASCNILVTQPRRISAVSLSARLSSERGQQLGDSIGHHVRFSVKYPPLPGNIVFVSTGILLQRLLFDPTLSDISHVIIDEAHERDLNTDLLLMLMKELLNKNDKIKIVIMSATINAEFFQNYFNNCPLLSIPGRMYPVQTHYIDDSELLQFFNEEEIENENRDIDDKLIADVVSWINETRPPGAVLVFLPGWMEIASVRKRLEDDPLLLVLTAHSKMKIDQQELIFEKPPEGKRKVILATNIAESSITIPDVVYVVDSGLMKSLGTYKGIRGVFNTWISKAVADQRSGRAGRVSEGECFRLYSRKKYKSFIEYPVPEVLRAPLESLAMRIKMYSDEKLLDIITKFPNKPPIRTVNEAVRYLQKMKVFDSTEKLTPLGRRIALIGLHPLLSVSLVYSVFFRCLDPMLFVTSNLNGDGTLFGIGTAKKERRNTLTQYHQSNDHLAMYQIYRNWLTIQDSSTADGVEESCDINRKALETFNRVIHLNLNYLSKAYLVSENDIYYDVNISTSNKQSMVAPTLLAATGRLAINDQPYNHFGKINHFLKTLDGKRVQIANESVNFRSSRNASPFLNYYNMSSTEEGFLRIYGTAQVSLEAALLFCPVLPEIYPTMNGEKYELRYPNTDLCIVTDKQTLDYILCLRDMTWTSLNFFISHFDSSNDEPVCLSDFRNELISVLDSVVNNCDK